MERDDGIEVAVKKRYELTKGSKKTARQAYRLVTAPLGSPESVSKALAAGINVGSRAMRERRAELHDSLRLRFIVGTPKS